MEKHERGQSLVELLVTLAIIGMLTALSAAAAVTAYDRLCLGAATAEMRGALANARQLAMARDRNVALKFRFERGEWTWSLHEDGDGDGVRNDDIARGIDRQLEPPRRLARGPARIGLPHASIRDPVTGGRLDTRSAVRFGNSTLCSVSRDGDVTNGSLVLTDGRRAVLLIVHGTMCRVSVLRYDGERWSGTLNW
jgi:prepilin-type N-terminal cleavage/methylation domain-containing protein